MSRELTFILLLQMLNFATQRRKFNSKMPGEQSSASSLLFFGKPPSFRFRCQIRAIPSLLPSLPPVPVAAKQAAVTRRGAHFCRALRSHRRRRSRRRRTSSARSSANPPYYILFPVSSLSLSLQGRPDMTSILRGVGEGFIKCPNCPDFQYIIFRKKGQKPKTFSNVISGGLSLCLSESVRVNRAQVRS